MLQVIFFFFPYLFRMFKFIFEYMNYTQKLIQIHYEIAKSIVYKWSDREVIF